jgi:excisionase family DNA binding protein
MEKIKKDSSENTEEAQSLENGLKILTRIMVKTVMSEISIQRKIINQVDVEPVVLSPKIQPEQQEESLLLNVSEGARLLRVSRSRVYELVHSRQIPSIRFGKRILLPRAALIRFIDEAASKIGELRAVVEKADAEIVRLQGIVQVAKQSQETVAAAKRALEELRDINLKTATFQQKAELVARLGIKIYPSEDLTYIHMYCILNITEPRKVTCHKTSMASPKL